MPFPCVGMLARSSMQKSCPVTSWLWSERQWALLVVTVEAIMQVEGSEGLHPGEAQRHSWQGPYPRRAPQWHLDGPPSQAAHRLRFSGVAVALNATHRTLNRSLERVRGQSSLQGGGQLPLASTWYCTNN